MQARNAADHHLIETLNATTRAAIFTTSGQGNVDFTDDGVKLHEALLKLMSRPTISPGGSECPALSYYMADLIVNKSDQRALQTAVADVLANCLIPPPGVQTPAMVAATQQNARNFREARPLVFSISVNATYVWHLRLWRTRSAVFPQLLVNAP